MKKILITLFIIIFIFVCLFQFFFKLETIPNGLYIDEIVSGYNSYSILNTQKDEYGKSFPYAFRFFGSYTPPLYVYLSIIPIKIFGLNAFSLRFINALSGFISIFIIYLLAHKLNLISLKKINRLLILVSIPFLPWLIFFSRIGYEIYLGFFISLLGIYYSFLSLKKVKLLPISFIFITLSSYSSHPQKFLYLIFIFTFLIIFRKQIIKKQNKKILLLSLFLVFIFSVPNLFLISQKAFFVKNDLFYINDIKSRAQKINISKFVSYPYSFIYEFSSRYFSYLSPKNLFFEKDPDPQRSLADLSLFYSWMAVPYLIGLYIVIKNKNQINYKYILFLWLISPIPASLTKDPFSTQRALPLFLPISLIIFTGINKLLNSGIIIKLIIIFLIIIYSPIILWKSYFIHFPLEKSVYWGYGYEQLFKNINNTNNYLIDNTRQKPLYIAYLFYKKINPSVVQNLHSKNLVENYYSDIIFIEPKKINNVEFRSINWEKDICIDQIIIGDNLSFSENNIKEHFLTKIFEVKNYKNNILFVSYKTNPTLKCKNN